LRGASPFPAGGVGCKCHKNVDDFALTDKIDSFVKSQNASRDASHKQPVTKLEVSFSRFFYDNEIEPMSTTSGGPKPGRTEKMHSFCPEK
jgi:hypothetical protein